MSAFIDMTIDFTNIMNPTKGAAERIGCSFLFYQEFNELNKKNYDRTGI